MRDALVFHRLIATPCFHKQTDAGQGRVVLQWRYHQAVWKLGHLKQQRILCVNLWTNIFFSYIWLLVTISCWLKKCFRGCQIAWRREQHLPGHSGEGEGQPRTVCGQRGVQSELHSSWRRHSNVSVGSGDTSSRQMTSFSSCLTFPLGNGKHEHMLRNFYCPLLNLTVFLCRSVPASSSANITVRFRIYTLSPTGLYASASQK